MSQALRVAGIAISPPGIKASGGVSAGIQLMMHVAKICETHMLVMSDKDAEHQEGALPISSIAATNRMAPLAGVLPSAAYTLQWRVPVGDWLDQVKPDVVHLHNPHPPGAFADAARACERRNIPYVITTHGFVEFDDYSLAFGSPAWQKPILDILVRRPVVKTARGADTILMLSPQEEPILLRMGVDKSRLDVAPNGVDSFFVDPLPDKERSALIERFNLPSDRTRIFFVGNHTPNKGIDVLLQAASKMKTDGVVIIAGGIRSQDQHSLMLRDAGFDMASGRAIFTDFISRDELKALYQSSDIFAFPSRADTLPLVILEAMVSKLPVVSTKVGGIPYQVTDETGILVDSGDATALADALDRLSRDSSLRVAMGEAGRVRALDLFDWDNSAEIAVTNYERLTGKVRA